MMKRRLKAAGLPGHFSPHSFRVTTVTDLLEQNVPLEDVQYLAGHCRPAHDADLRPAAAEGHAEHRGADLDLIEVPPRVPFLSVALLLAPQALLWATVPEQRPPATCRLAKVSRAGGHSSRIGAGSAGRAFS